jgi:hypothetical protein
MGMNTTRALSGVKGRLKILFDVLPVPLGLNPRRASFSLMTVVFMKVKEKLQTKIKKAPELPGLIEA